MVKPIRSRPKRYHQRNNPDYPDWLKTCDNSLDNWKSREINMNTTEPQRKVQITETSG